MSSYDSLNDRQQEAVFHTDGPVLILAGAGSGKTRVLTHRVAYLIENKNVNPWNILAITFTNKAAGEMRERVDDIVGFGSESIWVSTFHSTCVWILRRYIEPVSYTHLIPNIDLYMDQVTTLMDSKLKNSTRNPEEDKILTKTMINNYAKNNLLPPPVKKKYSKEHVLILIFIYYYKGVMSINDIQTILQPITDLYFKGNTELSLEDIYNEVFSLRCV